MGSFGRYPKNMSRSVHDNHLVSYEVDGIAKQIVLHTAYAYGEEPYEKTDVIFEGVLDHYFRNSILPSIVFDVEEVEIQAILIRDKNLINEGYRNGGWPSFWRESTDEMLEAISNSGCKMFEISSSYGLDGWVAAASCEFKPANENEDNKASISTPDPPSLETVMTNQPSTQKSKHAPGQV